MSFGNGLFLVLRSHKASWTSSQLVKRGSLAGTNANAAPQITAGFEGSFAAWNWTPRLLYRVSIFSDYVNYKIYVRVLALLPSTHFGPLYPGIPASRSPHQYCVPEFSYEALKVHLLHFQFCHITENRVRREKPKVYFYQFLFIQTTMTFQKHIFKNKNCR
jgi:hypothetical protein